MTPTNFPRRILLCVTGLTPQIVTETLYALAVSHNGVSPAPTGKNLTPVFIPTEIHIITTSEGAQRARLALLDPVSGEFHKLCRDYGLNGIDFSAENIHTIPDANGIALSDIRSPEDNARAADFLLEQVRKFCDDDNAVLHVSIAGGRKTMGFFLGYALSLVGRAQDRMSHVLVSAPFEALTDFYFPPKTPRVLHTRDGKPVHTSDAQITLAEIPFVRLRHGLPEELQRGTASFGDAVFAVQQNITPVSIEFDLPNKTVHCGGRVVPMPPKVLAWFAWWALLKKMDFGSAGRVTWSGASQHVPDFLRIYKAVVGADSASLAKAEKIFINADGMEQEFFQTTNSKLEKALEVTLGLASRPYLLSSSGKRPNTLRGLSVPPDVISLAPTAKAR